MSRREKAGTSQRPPAAIGPRQNAKPVRPPRARRSVQARKPRVSLRSRIAPHLPSRGRVLAALLAAALVAGFVVLLNGPWLRVTQVAWQGGELTADADLEGRVDAVRGENALLVDSAALRRRIEALPAVATARVDVRLPGTIAISLTEEAPAFVWRTRTMHLIGAADGTVIGQRGRDEALPEDLAALPYVDDRRNASRDLTVGDRIDIGELRIALELSRLDARALGSETRRASVHIDDEYGFVLDSADPEWSAAFGFYGVDPQADEDVAARIERQVGAVRTLFNEEDEAAIAWLDVRNPGRVYWRPRG
jgi:hypothetical protein